MKGHVDQWCKENCDANNVEELKGVMRGKRRGRCAMLLILFSTITISVSFNRSSTRTLKFILILSLTKLFNHGN